MAEIVFVYVTHPETDGARALGRALVEVGLAACANVLPDMKTVYRWQGCIEEGGEAVLIVKTRADLVDALKARIRAEHPYDCPCVAVLPVVGGDPGYLAWIAASCRPAPPADDVVRPAGLEPATKPL